MKKEWKDIEGSRVRVDVGSTSKEALSRRMPAEVICFTKDGEIIFNGIAYGVRANEVTYVDRGQWQQGVDYFCMDINPETGIFETSDVWYYGCKYRCCKNLTKTAPAWNNSDWAMIEGNPNFTVDFVEPESLADPENVNLTLTIVATKYNMDVTKDVLEADVIWTRYSEDNNGVERNESDAIWNARHEGAGKSIRLTKADMNFESYMPKVIRFTATVTLRDNSSSAAATESVSYEL